MSFKLKSIYHMSLWGSYMSLYDNSGGDKGATERGARHTPQVHTVSTKKIESDHFFSKKVTVGTQKGTISFLTPPLDMIYTMVINNMGHTCTYIALQLCHCDILRLRV